MAGVRVNSTQLLGHKLYFKTLLVITKSIVSKSLVINGIGENVGESV